MYTKRVMIGYGSVLVACCGALFVAAGGVEPETTALGVIVVGVFAQFCAAGLLALGFLGQEGTLRHEVLSGGVLTVIFVAFTALVLFSPGSISTVLASPPV